MRRFLIAGISAVAIGASVGLAACATSTETAAASARNESGKEIVAARRVNESQYRAFVAEVFGEDIEISGRFEPDQRLHGLLAIGSADLSISAGGFEQYFAMARAIASQVLDEERRATFVTCAPADPTAADDACTSQVVRKYGRLAFRRPLSDAEVQSRLDVAAEGAAEQGDYYAGLELALVSLLSAPEFLFRVEVAEPDPTSRGELRLDGYTRAARLSYLLWNTAPDSELLDAAERGDLYTDQGLRAQVERMAASDKLDAGFRALFTDVMQLELFDSVTKDAGTYPKYSTTVANSAREQTLRTLVDHLVTRRGDYREIFTTPHTFIDRPLASVYKIPFLSDEEWQAYTYPDDVEQAGVLTQVTFMSLFSHPARSSPTKRGDGLNQIFMCFETPLPPPDVDFSILQDTSNPLRKTVRARLEAHATSPGCAGCHSLLDPLGLALERYDGIGQYRTTENGEQIDVSSSLAGVPFEGAAGLGRALSQNPQIPQCFVRNVYAYGVGRDPTSAWEREYLAAQTAAFAQNGYVAPDLIIQIATSPAFFQVAYPEPEVEGQPQADTVAQSSNPEGSS